LLLKEQYELIWSSQKLRVFNRIQELSAPTRIPPFSAPQYCVVGFWVLMGFESRWTKEQSMSRSRSLARLTARLTLCESNRAL
jgi:hypothetical protein